MKRYLIFRRWPWYEVHLGTQRDVLYKSFRYKAAREIAYQLEEAFREGKYEEYMFSRSVDPKS